MFRFSPQLLLCLAVLNSTVAIAFAAYVLLFGRDRSIAYEVQSSQSVYGLDWECARFIDRSVSITPAQAAAVDALPYRGDANAIVGSAAYCQFPVTLMDTSNGRIPVTPYAFPIQGRTDVLLALLDADSYFVGTAIYQPPVTSAAPQPLQQSIRDLPRDVQVAADHAQAWIAEACR